MLSVSRAGVVTSAVVGICATALGVGWYVAGAAHAPGMAQYAAIAVGTSLLGGFVLWHRPGNRYGLAHLTLGVLFGSAVLAVGALSYAAPLPGWPAQAALAWSWLVLGPLLPLWVVVIAAFPDGRFHRRFLRPATIGLGVVMTGLGATAYLFFPAGTALSLIRLTPPGDLAGPLAGTELAGLYPVVNGAGAVLGTLAPVLALAVLVDRYRTAGVVVRQQIKWLLFGAAVSVLLQAIPVRALDQGVLRAAVEVLVVLAVPLPLLAAAVAIFKYGLWEIDVVISHGLVYAVVSGVLSAVFLLAAFGAGLTVGGADARVVAAVGLALLVSYLARPLRGRLGSWVARLLYGDEPRGLLALSRLTDAGTGAADPRGQGALIAEVARNALAAPWARVWLYLHTGTSAALQPLAASGVPEGPVLVVPEEVAGDLPRLARGRVVSRSAAEGHDVLGELVGDRGAAASLVVKGDVVGLVACGARAREPFTDEDLELLAVLARESALLLQNVRLEGELRQRLTQIERQAEQLRRSRQRLVSVQDGERRRIERDLHDGAQQQLVSLAARLRRAAGAGGLTGGQLADLADEAEEAVFTLQELARGIYPSLLVDRGLPAALQAHAARLPVQVRVEVAPSVLDRRLPPDLEAVLYYVALEAMTNAVKHAPGASVSVLLRAGDRPHTVVLEVHDDGPGFAVGSTASSGLQNMVDRVEAVGGVLTVESGAGAGTWVRAEVTEPATVTGIRSAAASRAGRPAPPPPAG